MIDIKEVQRLAAAGRLNLTRHALHRMKQRNITINDILTGIGNGEIIEQYPDDFPFPSCLVLGMTFEARYIHIVLSVSNETINIITVYYPDTEKWERAFIRITGGV